MTLREQIQKFFASPSFGVAGASNDPRKFGHKVFRRYLQHGLKAVPINPHETEIAGHPVLANVAELGPETQSLSVITPPPITEQIVREAVAHGIKNIWMQPGAESPEAIRFAKDHGVNVIAGGPCVLVELDSL